MNPADVSAFGAALREVFALYGKQLPTKGALDHWLSALAPFPADVIADAFQQHIDASGFPPVPSDIRALCIQSRKHHADAATLRLTHTPKADADLVKLNLGKLQAIVTPLTNKPSAEWAFRLLDRGTSASGGPLTPEVLRVAGDAVASTAGRKVLASTHDPDLRSRYEAIYRAVEAQRRQQ